MNRLDDERFYEPDIEAMPREELEKLQEARLLQLLPYVYNRSPLVRWVWDQAGIKPDDIKSMADFKAKVPFIDKDTIRQFRDEHDDPFGGLVCVEPPHLKGVGFTSGTTGDPTPIPRTEYTIPIKSCIREFWQIGVRPGDFFVHMLFTFREGLASDRWAESGMKPLQIQHLPHEVPHLISSMRKYRPKALFMLSTPMIMALEHYQKQTGDDLKEAFSSIEGVVFGGEPLNPVLRSLVESWGLEIFELTSLGDIATAMECKAHDGMHTWEDLALIEHLNPDSNEDMPDGSRGELVVTALADDVAPLIRYRTDDLVSFTREQCTCGRTHGRLKPIGRKTDEMIIRGRSVLPIDIFPLMQHFPETHSGLFQLVRPQRVADELTLRVGYDESAMSCSMQELQDKVAAKVGEALNIPVKVQLVANEEMLKNGPPNKIPRVVKP